MHTWDRFSRVRHEYSQDSEFLNMVWGLVATRLERGVRGVGGVDVVPGESKGLYNL